MKEPKQVREPRRGAVVKFYKYGGWRRGIVLRLLPWDNYSRAYGRQAEVLDPKTASVEEVGLGDMLVLGRVKQIPKIGSIEVLPSASEIARHERFRDLRRAGQGTSYDPNAERNRHYEQPLPPTTRSVLVKAKTRKKRGCVECGASTHLTSGCPLKNPGVIKRFNQDKKKKTRCSRCGASTHLARTCPIKRAER